ncbi:MAG: hypothetical protein ABSC35_15585 [Candidatus Dormibacteria bacterium]|jgi:hypothetical protein
MALMHLRTPVPGRVGGSTLTVMAIRGDAATDLIEVAEIHDASVALGDMPENTTRRTVRAADFRPWPQQTRFIGGQPFVLRWAFEHPRCAGCDTELEHFGYAGTAGGDVREHGQGVGPPIWYCDSCARGE